MINLQKDEHYRGRYLLAHLLLENQLDNLPQRERKLIELCARRHAQRTHLTQEDIAPPSLGQRLADYVAQFGGSWTFIIIFILFLWSWVALNAWFLPRPFDPYPFIFFNLILSMLAALQAPIIMMSQNRAASHDRVRAEEDFEVNLRAEAEISALHEKLDMMRHEEITPFMKQVITRIDALEQASKRP